MSEQFPTLYKTNSNGSTQQWTIQVIQQDEQVGGRVFIQKIYGQVGGALQTSDPDYIDGKNFGKANETSPLEQAMKEAWAQWTKKKTGGKGYVEDPQMAAAGETDALVTGGIVPMLAHKFRDHGHKIVYPCAGQPKLDGIRCIATIVDGKCTLWTRTQKPIVSMPHIIAAIDAHSESSGTKNLTLDGELYNHEYRDRFEDIVSLVRPSYVKEGSEVVQYHIYDAAIPVASFRMRMEQLIDFLDDDSVIEGPLHLVETVEIQDIEDMMEYFNECRFAGYEGAMARNSGSSYENKRSYNLLKIKEFDDAEFKIIDVVEGRGKMGGKAVFVCETATGEVFNVKMEGALSELAKIFNEKSLAIGKMLTVRYQGLTNGNVPRFPIGISIRDYE